MLQVRPESARIHLPKTFPFPPNHSYTSLNQATLARVQEPSILGYISQNSIPGLRLANLQAKYT